MRRSSVVKIALSCLAGLAVGMLVFFPWRSVGDYAAAKGLATAASNGVYASIQSYSSDGLFDKQFMYRGVIADFPVFRFSAGDVVVDPLMLRSILKFTPTCTVKLGKGEIIPLTRQKLAWKSGSMNVALGKDTVSITEIWLTGDFSARGFLEVSKETGKIARANLTLKVPADMDRALEIFGSNGILPLTKIRDGEWKVER